MAKNTKEQQTTIPTGEQSTSTALALPPRTDDDLYEQLAAAGDVDDGLGEIEAKDIKWPTKVFNFKGVDNAGDPIPANVFYDTVTEQVTRVLRLVLLKLHKTNEWREYNEAAGKSEIKCRSRDRVTGQMENGTQRPCEGCPDAKWETTTDKEGKAKRSRRCSEVWNFVTADIETQQPTILRFRKTSLPVIQSYLNKHHLGQRKQGSSRGNWHLYAFVCEVTLKMVTGKSAYAVPVINKLGNTPRDLVEMAVASMPFINEVFLGELDKAAEADRSDDAGGESKGDSSFDYGDDAAGGGFVDPENAAAAG